MNIIKQREKHSFLCKTFYVYGLTIYMRQNIKAAISQPFLISTPDQRGNQYLMPTSSLFSLSLCLLLTQRNT